MQGERTRARLWQEGGDANGGTETVGRTLKGEARLAGQLGQVVVPAESREDVSAYGICKGETIMMFDI